MLHSIFVTVKKTGNQENSIQISVIKKIRL
nr:MAG TPA: hypothetical protein [Caudoviricetes sp.]